MRELSHTDIRQLFEDRTLKHLTTLSRLGCYITNDRSESDHLVEKTILTAYENFDHQIDSPPQDDKLWLCKIMVRFLDERHSRRERLKRVLADQKHDDQFIFNRIDDSEYTEDSDDADDNPFSDLSVEDIRGRLKELPYDFRLILALRYLDGFTYEQIGEIADLQEGTVKTRLQKGRRLLYSSLLQEAAEA